MDKKWNLQDIKPAEPRRRRREVSEEDLVQRPPRREVAEESDGTVHIGVENGTKKKRSLLIIALAVFIMIVAGGFLVSYLLGGAEVNVFPRTREPNVNATFSAYQTPQVGELAYEILTLEADGERQVSATGQEETQELATGEIIIYNNTDETQRLVKNTRFMTEEGLIFRITESAVVPPAGTDDTGAAVPGTVTASVFADDYGEEYNIAPTRLTVPGYEEGGFTELYENVYAENPSAMTGGFSGMKFIIDENELATQKQSLQQELRDALLERLESERPAGFIVFKDAVTFTYESQPAVEYGENLATIKEKALLRIPIFEEHEFAAYIAAATVPGYEDRPVRIEDPEALSFAYTNATTSSSNIANQTELEFEITGQPLIVWTFDEGKLKTDLLGKQKTALSTVLSGYPSIERAEAVVRPFWQRSFPDELEEIKVVEHLTEAEEG